MLKRFITTTKYTYNIDTFVLLTFRIGEFSTRSMQTIMVASTAVLVLKICFRFVLIFDHRLGSFVKIQDLIIGYVNKYMLMRPRRVLNQLMYADYMF